MNNDYLRVNSKNEQQDIVVGEFKNQTEKQTKEVKEKKVTLLTLLNFSPTPNTPYTYTLKTPNIKGVFSILFLLAFVVCSLCFVSYLTHAVILLIFTASVAAITFPLFLIIFAYKLDTTNGVSILEILIGTLLGVSLHIIINLTMPYMITFISYAWIKELFYVIFSDLIIFVTATVFVRFAKKDNMFDAMLLTVAVYAGYMFIDFLFALMHNMFLNVQVYKGSEVVSTGAIILGDVNFTSLFNAYLKTLFVDVIFFSIIIGCSSIINGGLIGLNVSPIKDEKYKEWSLYCLFLLTVILHVAALFPSTIQIFEIILKSISIIFSLTLAVTILNYYLSKAKFK